MNYAAILDELDDNYDALSMAPAAVRDAANTLRKQCQAKIPPMRDAVVSVVNFLSGSRQDRFGK